MPVYFDIMEHKVLGREYKSGLEEGRLELLRDLIGERFGAIPARAEKRLTSLPGTELREGGVRILKARNLEELLKARPVKTGCGADAAALAANPPIMAALSRFEEGRVGQADP